MLLAGFCCTEALAASDTPQGALGSPLGIYGSVWDETPLVAASVDAGEPLTEGGAGDCQGQKMTNTVWYSLTGDGARVLVRASSYHSMVAVYRAQSATMPAFDALAACAPYVVRGPVGATAEFQSLPGALYLVQVGACAPTTPFGEPFPPCYAPEEPTSVRAAAQTPNDQRAGASPFPVSAGVALPPAGAWTDSLASTTEPGELQACDNESSGPLQHTIWFRYEATGVGRLTVAASERFDIGNGWAIAAYRADSDTPLACQRGPAKFTVDIVPGTYLFRAHNGYFVDDFGTVGLAGAFVENLDVDGDGALKPSDCADADPAIRPGALDVPGNAVDEDCSGADASYPLVSAAPRAVWRVFDRHVDVRSLEVADVAAGTRITVRCHGGKRLGCAFRRTIRSYRSKPKKAVRLTSVFKGRSLRKGAVVELLASKPGHVTRLWRYSMRPPRAPLRRVFCQAPAAVGKVRC